MYYLFDGQDPQQRQAVLVKLRGRQHYAILEQGLWNHWFWTNPFPQRDLPTAYRFRGIYCQHQPQSRKDLSLCLHWLYLCHKSILYVRLPRHQIRNFWFHRNESAPVGNYLFLTCLYICFSNKSKHLMKRCRRWNRNIGMAFLWKRRHNAINHNSLSVERLLLVF